MKLLREYVRELLREEKKKGLWANIHAKRKRGEKPAKPGDKDYPDEKSLYAGLKLVGDFLEKSILKPNNLNYPLSRLQFTNSLK